MRRTLFCNGCFGVALLLSLLALAGCAKPPTQEMAKAEKAVEEAKQKEAHLYVPYIYKEAEDSLKWARESVVKKDYKEAKKSAEAALQISRQAVAMIQQSKAKMKADAETDVEAVQTDLEELKTLGAKVTKKKAFVSSEDIQTIIGKVEIDLVSIREKLDKGVVKQAYDDVKATKEQLSKDKEMIERATAGKGRRPLRGSSLQPEPSLGKAARKPVGA